MNKQTAYVFAAFVLVLLIVAGGQKPGQHRLLQSFHSHIPELAVFGGQSRFAPLLQNCGAPLQIFGQMGIFKKSGHGPGLIGHGAPGLSLNTQSLQRSDDPRPQGV